MVPAPCFQNPYKSPNIPSTVSSGFSCNRSGLHLHLNCHLFLQQMPPFGGFCQKFSMPPVPFLTPSHVPCVPPISLVYLLHSSLAAGSPYTYCCHTPCPRLLTSPFPSWFSSFVHRRITFLLALKLLFCSFSPKMPRTGLPAYSAHPQPRPCPLLVFCGAFC